MITIFFLGNTVVFCIVGIFNRKLAGTKPNSLVGIRTKETLNNPEFWQKVNKDAKYVFFLTGLVNLGFSICSIFYRFNIIVAAGLYLFSVLLFFGLLFALIRKIKSELPIQEFISEDQPVDIPSNSTFKFFVIGGGLFFIIIGALMPKIAKMGPNRLIGIRTRYSMSSQEIWSRMHNEAMVPMIITGIIMLLIGYALLKLPLSDNVKILLWGISMFVAVLISNIYISN